MEEGGRGSRAENFGVIKWEMGGIFIETNYLSKAGNIYKLKVGSLGRQLTPKIPHTSLLSLDKGPVEGSTSLKKAKLFFIEFCYPLN